MTVRAVRDAYAARAAEYASLFGAISVGHPDDVRCIREWGDQRTGPVLDVGCGPGQWTALLAQRGVDVEGIDLVPTFIAHATQNYPGLRFREGDARALGVADASLDGVLAWYSLIHLAPDALPEVLAEFARSIRTGGSLLIGCFDGEARTPFRHAVVTAWFWSADALGDELARAGFATTEVVTRTDPGSRPHLAIVATRLPPQQPRETSVLS